MFKDYKDLVVKSYREKLASRELSNNLSDPTPAKLRDECLLVYTSRYDKERDAKTLEAFFGKPGENDDYYPIIYNVKVSLFKPLAQYLHDTSRKPNTRNIELLAWLINYQPRPFRSGSTIVEPIPAWKEWIKKHLRESAAVLLLTGIIVFLLMKIPQKEQCMYWSGDRYKAIDCDQKPFDAQSIALDTFKLNHFKRITRPDTMTAYSVGRVWCVQIGEIPDCFTTDGNHPLHPERELKRLSLTILRKHFGTKLPDSLQDQPK
ncbi:hypothetical protein SAMN05421820_1153 [Pedobacter steynii]|uniref:Uncharacterized protein n=1 Tax=Pedobacter steynii TaxID=430522 RepID=A0A1H0JKG4_9SPHI|nr:hypothetical protein [Pedobacter steynii]NQX43098.1 hypothetical protein [Pedobacter steynii]SDO44216.1 hypothetical protein SAMN05421820_1153 [Pedobacter steynii]